MFTLPTQATLRLGGHWIFILLVGLLLSLTHPLAAQEASTEPTEAAAALEAEGLAALIEVLENPDQRDALLEAMRAATAGDVAAQGPAADPAEPPETAEAPETAETPESTEGPETPDIAEDRPNLLPFDFAETLDLALTELEETGAELSDLSDPHLLAIWLSGGTAYELETALLNFVGQLGLILAAALILRWVMRGVTAGVRGKVSRHARESETVGRWSFTALLAVLELLPLAVVGLVFNLGLPLLDLPISVSFSAVLTINALIAARAIHLVAKTLLVPREVPPPPMPLRPESRGYLYIWIKRFTNVITFGVLIDGLAALALMPEGPRLLMIRLIGLAVLSMIFILVLQNRRHVGKSLGSSLRDAFGDTPLTTLAARFAELWHVFVLLYASGLFFTWFLGIHGGFTFTTLATLRSVLVIIAGILIYRLIRKGMTMLFALSDDLCRTFPGLERRSNRYFSVMLGIMRIGVTVLTVLTLLDMWNLDTLAILTSPEGRVVVVRLISVLVMLGVGVVLWEIIANTADRYLAGREGQDGSVIEVSQRAKTLVPLIRTVLMIVLITIVSLVVLSEIGVNIGPLLAGAGVIGLAISFGSQRLVQDVITGAFNLIEDTIAVGDVVTIGGHSGVVEGLSIRSVRLRDLAGSVHTVPFSSVDTVTNMTKDFSYYVFNVGVGYRENTDNVCAVLVELGKELRADPEFGPQILEPLEILGVDSLADSAVVIKARFKTNPIKQWWVGREFNRRMKLRFDELGIEIPFPHTTIYFGEDKQGNAPPVNVRMGKPDPKPEEHTPTTNWAAEAPAAPAIVATDEWAGLAEADQSVGLTLAAKPAPIVETAAPLKAKEKARSRGSLRRQAVKRRRADRS